MALTDKVNLSSLTTLSEYAQIMLHSDCTDTIDIHEITQNIKDNFMNWVKSGILLDVVKKEFSFLVLREKMAKNWQEYCTKFLGKTHWYVNNIIKASQVVLILVKNGFNTLPDCEAQARPLTKFLPDYQQMNQEEIELMEQEVIDKWQRVIDYSNGKVITANMVKTIVNPDKVNIPENMSVTVDIATHEKLFLQALDLGYSNIADYLKAIANGEVNPESKETNKPLNDVVNTPEYQEKIKVWEEDLEQLIKEHEEEIKANTNNDSNVLDACEQLIKQVDSYFSRYWQLDIFGGRQVHRFDSA